MVGIGFELALLEHSLSGALMKADLELDSLDFDELKEVVQNLLQIQLDAQVFLDRVIEINEELENAEYSVVVRECR